jgi:hypothetical protein
MPSIATLCSSLATFGRTVTGIKDSFDLNAIPDKVVPAQLPCLIVVLPSQDLSQYQTLAQMGESATVDLHVEHWMLTDTTVKEAKRTEPTRAALLDAYIAAARAQTFLSIQVGTGQVVPMTYGIHITPVAWGDVVFEGLIFKYLFKLNY